MLRSSNLLRLTGLTSLRELKKTLSFASPLVATHLLDQSFGLVDSIMAGQLGVQSLAALGIANGVFWAVICVLSALLAGLETYMPRAVGQKDRVFAHFLLVQGFWMALFATCIAVILILVLIYGYSLVLDDPALIQSVWAYTLWVLPATPLILFVTVMQIDWQSKNVVFPFTCMMVTLSVLNYVLNEYLMPNWGVTGIALSTALCKLTAFILVAVATLYHQRHEQSHKFRQKSLWPHKAWILKLLRIGLPCSGFMLSDIVAFNILTFFAVNLDAMSIAVNQLMFLMTCVLVGVPLGLTHAAVTGVGQRLGQSKPRRALLVARTNLSFILIVQSGLCLILILYPDVFTTLLTRDLQLQQQLYPLVQLCGLFQLVDGLQIFYAGVLKAWGEVGRVFLAGVIAHYGIGLPLALIACFWLDFGVLGLWGGVTAGLCTLTFLNWCLWRRAVERCPSGADESV